MRHGSRIANIARGKLIDEEAPVSALESGQLFAAGLDVHYDKAECKPQISEDEKRGAAVLYGRRGGGESRWFRKVGDGEEFELWGLERRLRHLVGKSKL
jgi:lactate dehydrogenase-like 2-hydroxyacid dehydrogenase